MRNGTKRALWLPIALVALALVAAPACAQVKVDPKLPGYKPVAGVSGSINSVGSDTMNNLMTLWTEGFRKFYPAVRVEIEGKGTSTGPPAMIGGTATFAPMSREWKADETAAFKRKFGYEPTVLSTSIDMLAVYVNKDNPLESLSLAQIDAMFSTTRKLGYPDDIRTWGDAGLQGDWRTTPISLYGRNSASGTYAYFKEHALGKGDFKDNVNEQPGSSSVVQSVARNRSAIGYSGIGYKTADVRVVPLAAKENGEAVEVEPENAYNGTYPLARALYVTVNHRPNSRLDPLRREFIRYVFSKQGQEVVVKDGYLPVPAALARKQLEQVGIQPGF